jgi:MFS family permease
MRPASRLFSSGRRLLAGHAFAACATSVPVPLLARALAHGPHPAGALAALGAARMAPYLLLSGAAGRLADRMSRGALLRASTGARGLLLAAVAVAAAARGPVWVMAACTVTAVIAALPAYPAAGAALGAGGGPRGERHLAALTAVEAGAWVAGPALGGLLLTCGPAWTAPAVAAAMCAAAALLLPHALLRTPGDGPSTAAAQSRLAPIDGGLTRRRWAGAAGGLIRPLIAAAAVNVVVDATGAVLVQLASGARAYGLMTTALGSGSAVCLVACRRPGTRTLPALAGTAAGLLACAALPGTGPRVVALAVAGACAVRVETAATAAVQRTVPFQRRGQALGVLDQVVVGGAMVGTVTGPLTAAALTPPVTVAVAGLTALCAAAALTRRPRRITSAVPVVAAGTSPLAVACRPPAVPPATDLASRSERALL